MLHPLYPLLALAAVLAPLLVAANVARRRVRRWDRSRLEAALERYDLP